MTAASSCKESPGVLFTSAGRRVELVRLFKRAFEELGLESRVVALDIDALAPALHVADRAYLVPRLSEADYIPTVVDVCRRENVKLIFPLIDPDVPVITRRSAEIEATGAKVATIPYEGVAITGDKWLTTRFFAGLGLPVPRSWLPDGIDSAEQTFPLFIKPRNGSASKDAFQVRNERELTFFLDYVPDPIIQELLPGPEITCDVVCDVDGGVLSVVARQRIEVRGGEVVKGMTVHDPFILDACVKIAGALAARGPFTVQCIMKAGQPHFTEINARFGGGFPLGVAAGANSPCWLLARAAGIYVSIPPLGTYEKGLYLTRFDDSHFLTEAEYARLAGSTLRSG